MCGICGYITLDNKKPAVTIKQAHNMLKSCMTRGQDATGVYWANADTDNIFKLPVKATEFIPMAPWADILKSTICLMHTRHATQGDPDENENNHPLFDRDTETILIHNGIINNSDIFVSPNITDSYAILEAYANAKTEKISAVKALKKAITKLEGSMACAMFRRETGRLFLWKSDNPMCIAHKKNTLLFASTTAIITEVMPEYINIVPDNYLMTIKNGRIKGVKIKKKEIAYKYTGKGVNWYDQNQWDKRGNAYVYQQRAGD